MNCPAPVPTTPAPDHDSVVVPFVLVESPEVAARAPRLDANALCVARTLLMTGTDIDVVAGVGLLLADDLEAHLTYAKRVD